MDDLADACILLMEKYDYRDIGEFVNIGTGTDIKIKDLAFLMKRIVGFEGEIVNDRTKPDGTPKKLLDISKIASLGWKARMGLDEGIRMAYKAYLSRGSV